MKKLVVLMLVVGMASLASAAISLSVAGATSTGVDTYDIGVGAVATLGIESDSSDAFSTYLYIGGEGQFGTGSATDNGIAGVSNGVDLSGGNLSSIIQDYYGYGMNLNAADSGGALVPGTQFTADLTVGGIAGDTFVVSLTDPADYLLNASTLSFTVVPEPMTMALLGLGGLFLRRKK